MEKSLYYPQKGSDLNTFGIFLCNGKDCSFWTIIDSNFYSEYKFIYKLFSTDKKPSNFNYTFTDIEKHIPLEFKEAVKKYYKYTFLL